MPMVGYAWSENAGWISFNPRNAIDTAIYTNSDVFFDKSAGRFHGFAWSENIGWISMEGLMTDITPPSLPTNPFAANSSKTLTTDPSPIVPTGTSYTLSVEKWDSTAVVPYTSTSGSPSFTHDFRQAKWYYLKVTDPF